MAALKIHKVVAALPATLEADAIYAVRTGSGFDLYVADSTGTIAHALNAAPTDIVPRPGGPAAFASGDYFVPQCGVPVSCGNFARAANDFRGAPVAVGRTVTLQSIGTIVATAVADALGRLSLYDAGPTGLPTALIWASGDLDYSTTGAKPAACGITLQAGRMYWIFHNHSSTASLREVVPNFGACLSFASSTIAGWLPNCSATSRPFATPPSAMFDPAHFNSTYNSMALANFRIA